jgi:hypothetical protein
MSLRCYISKVFVEDLNITVHDFECNQLVVSVRNLADEEQGGIAPVYNLILCEVCNPAWMRPSLAPFFLVMADPLSAHAIVTCYSAHL